MRITQVTTVKGRREHVERHISRWMNSGIDELVLVDYNCPQQTTQEAILGNSLYRDDPRITIVQVPEKVSGPAFCLTRARNIGALAAKHETFFFQDADCWSTGTFIEHAKQQLQAGRSAPFELLVTNPKVYDEDLVQLRGLPAEWVRDGQCFIRSHAFHVLHGYNECFGEWGGESYDLYIRASISGMKIGSFNPMGLHCLPHPDHLRTQYTEQKFTDDLDGRENRYRNSLRRLKNQRRLTRATPGARVGISAKEAPQLKLYRGGRLRAWRPGEDDSCL